jgi:hypothetical protein
VRSLRGARSLLQSDVGVGSTASERIASEGDVDWATAGGVESATVGDVDLALTAASEPLEALAATEATDPDLD